MKEFDGKRILMFSPKFFGYDLEIAEKLREFGATVFLFDERPSNAFITKVFIRLRPHLLKKRILKYFSDIFNQVSELDIIFFFKGETALPEVVNLARKKEPRSKIILYLIDSIANYPHLESSVNLFDRAFSFDLHDSNKFPSIHFRPLFYLDDYSILYSKEPNSIDLLFIGTVHSDRWPFLEKIKLQAEQHGLKTHYYLFFQSPILFFLQKMLNKNFRSIPFSAANFKSIQKSEILNLIKRSKVIVDIQHPKQTGLTMRTIEVFGAKRKLITTNEHIKKYDLYISSNIQVVNRYEPILDVSFFQFEYMSCKNSTYEKYSITNWLVEIFRGI